MQFERTPSGVLFKFRPLTVKDVGDPRGSWRWVETCRDDVSGFALRSFCGGPMTIIYYIGVYIYIYIYI